MLHLQVILKIGLEMVVLDMLVELLMILTEENVAVLLTLISKQLGTNLKEIVQILQVHIIHIGN